MSKPGSTWYEGGKGQIQTVTLTHSLDLWLVFLLGSGLKKKKGKERKEKRP